MYVRHLDDTQITEFRDALFNNTPVAIHVLECGVCRGRLTDAVVLMALTRPAKPTPTYGHLKPYDIHMLYRVSKEWESMGNNWYFDTLKHIAKCDICLGEYLNYAKQYGPTPTMLDRMTNLLGKSQEGMLGYVSVVTSPQRAKISFSANEAIHIDNDIFYRSSDRGVPTVNLGGNGAVINDRLQLEVDDLIFNFECKTRSIDISLIYKDDGYKPIVWHAIIISGGGIESREMPNANGVLRLNLSGLSYLVLALGDRRWSLKINIRQSSVFPEDVAEIEDKRRRQAEIHRQEKEMAISAYRHELEIISNLSPQGGLLHISNSPRSISAYQNILLNYENSDLKLTETAILERLVNKLASIKRGPLVELRKQLVELLAMRAHGRDE